MCAYSDLCVYSDPCGSRIVRFIHIKNIINIYILIYINDDQLYIIDRVEGRKRTTAPYENKHRLCFSDNREGNSCVWVAANISEKTEAIACSPGNSMR